MTITINSGTQFGSAYIPANTITWDDLGSSPYGSFASWTAWNVAPATSVEVQIDDDLTVSGYFTPLINFEYQGDIAVQLKISETGSFTGEETTIDFVLDTEESWVKGRYFRWTLTASNNSSEDAAIFAPTTNYRTTIFTEIVNDVNVYTDYTQPGTQTIATNLGAVVNIQATALQGGEYFESGYVFTNTEQQAATRTGTELNTVQNANTNNLVTIDSNTTAVPGGSGSMDFGTQDDVSPDGEAYLQIANPDNDFFSATTDTTIEFWFYPTLAPDSNVNSQTILDIDGVIHILLYPDVAVSGTDCRIGYVINESGGNTTTIKHADISTNQWHHFAVTIENGTLVESFVNGGDGAAPTLGSTVGQTGNDMFIGGGTGARDYAGYIDDLRISSVLRYTDVFTPPSTEFVPDTDANTVLYLDGNTIADNGGTVYSTAEYMGEQRGGSPVIESKNPPTIKVVNYAGDVWDGTVDVVLRGYPKIVLKETGVEPAVVEGAI